MTIWILAVLLLAALAGMGYRQGAIRVAFSLIGIVLGVLLAVPLARLFKPLLSAVGVQNPALLWVLAPFVGFVLILAMFKIAGLAAHQKVDVYFKYKGGDLRLALWERLNRRLGLCLGLMNGAAYLILISFVIYAFSYWTVQMATDDADPRAVRTLNRLGQDLDRTGMAKVARAIDRLPETYYEAADVVGLIYHNPLLEARLSRYPAFLSLAERQEFRELAEDPEFHDKRLRREPLAELLNHHRAQAIVNNPETLRMIWDTAAPNLKDLRTFLETGESTRFDQIPILGRWNFDVTAALMMVRKARPNVGSVEMQRLRLWMTTAFEKTSFVAAPDNQAFLKNVPRMGAAAAGGMDMHTLQGKWSGDRDKYQLTFDVNGGTEAVEAVVDRDRLTITREGVTMAFLRED
jgi:uncharacterized membrane protein required for colicin V production